MRFEVSNILAHGWKFSFFFSLKREDFRLDDHCHYLVLFSLDDDHCHYLQCNSDFNVHDSTIILLHS